MLPQVCMWVRLLPTCLLCGRNPGPCRGPRWGKREARIPLFGHPHHLAQPEEAGVGGPVRPGPLASPHGAASPTIPPARHLSIRVHKPGSETPASESWGGGVPLPPHPWFLSTLESIWEAAASRWGWGLRFRSQMEGPEGGTGLHLFEARAWRSEDGRSQRPTHCTSEGSVRSCDICLNNADGETEAHQA